MKNIRQLIDKYERSEKFERFAPKQKQNKPKKGSAKMKPIQKRLEDYE